MTDTAQAISLVTQAVPQVGAALNLATMSGNQLMETIAAIAGGGVALEQALEKFGFDKAPAAIKPYVPAIVAIGGTAAVSMSQGMPWQQALGLGVGTYVISQLKHDHAPAATAAVATETK